MAGSALGQTYQVGQDAPSTKPVPQQQGKGRPQPAAAAAAPQSDSGLGFGSNIQNARLARGAELALQRGDKAQAFAYAQRAAEASPNDPQLWFLLGYAARLDGRLGPSADAYQHGLKLKPSSIDGMSGLAQTYSASGRTADAERLLRQVVAADPSRHTELSMLGEISMKQGNYQGALDWLGRAERIQGTAQTELLMAVAYLHLKQPDMASKYLEMARTRDPNNPDVERSLAAYYRETGDYPKAVASLQRIRNPKPDVVAELGYTYQLAGRPEDAAKSYAQAASAMPRDLNLQLSAAQAFVTLAQYDQAENFLGRAAKIDPTYYRLHAIRGTIAQAQDREADAANEFSQAIATLPASPIEGQLYGIQLHMNLIPLYASLNQPDKSRAELLTAQRLVSQINPQGEDRAAFLRIRSIIHSDLGEYDAALADIRESLKLRPNDPNSLQLSGDVLMKLGRTEEAVAVFQQVLTIDPHSRYALTALGFAMRGAGKNDEAAKYFNQLAQEYPESYVPYLALGDMYADLRDYTKAETNYAAGYKRAPDNAMIVAGGMAAAIEAHNLALAGEWQQRVTPSMGNVAKVLREEERYFYFTGNNQRSYDYAQQAIKLIPKDREVVVYLGYDLLALQHWDELQALTAGSMNMFPKEPDIPLLSGYVYKHSGDLEKAAEGFTEALRRDSTVRTAYTNRGFVYNDLHKPALAAADFEMSIKLKGDDPEPHMGLAFADLNLHQPQAAVDQTFIVEKLAGDSEMLHTVRATAYGRMGMLTKAAREYQAALKFDPNDASLYLGLANIYFAQRRYHESVEQLQLASQHSAANAEIYALMARANAELKDRDATMQSVKMAEDLAAKMPVNTPKGNATASVNNEKKPADLNKAATPSDIYVATGEALSILGDRDAAMERYNKALLLQPKDRISVRLAVAQEMAKQGKAQDAERQLALAQLEVDAKDAEPPTGEQLITMAGILQQLHEFQLSESYLERAQAAGAPDAAVRISLANSYLALGETRKAAAELAAVKNVEDSEVDYQYLLAEASLYQQEHRGDEALSAFSAATSDAGEDPTAEQGLLEAGASEGYRVNEHLSLMTTLVVQPIFEDSTVYVLDAKLDSPAGPVAPTDTARLPPPRSSIETNSITTFHLHEKGLPPTSGYFQVRNANGTISVPATGSIQPRNTTDYALNLALAPTLHLGNNVITFNSGVQGTLRRDTQSPVELNQNLVRGFTYFTTSSFFNAVSANGFISAEYGPFTQTPITEKQINGALNFRVGTPWGKTAMVTGWGANSQHFDSSTLGNAENFTTSTYIGLSRRFGQKLTVEAILEDLRSWRIEPYSPIHSAISQAIRPAGTIDYAPNKHLDFQAISSYESTRSFHVYDMIQNSFTVTYVRPVDRTFDGKTGKSHVKYPLRFSAGVRQEGFMNYNGNGSSEKLLPFFSLTIF